MAAKQYVFCWKLSEEGNVLEERFRSRSDERAFSHACSLAKGIMQLAGVSGLNAMTLLCEDEKPLRCVAVTYRGLAKKPSWRTAFFSPFATVFARNMEEAIDELEERLAQVRSEDWYDFQCEPYPALIPEKVISFKERPRELAWRT